MLGRGGGLRQPQLSFLFGDPGILLENLPVWLEKEMKEMGWGLMGRSGREVALPRETRPRRDGESSRDIWKLSFCTVSDQVWLVLFTLRSEPKLVGVDERARAFQTQDALCPGGQPFALTLKESPLSCLFRWGSSCQFSDSIMITVIMSLD